MSARYTPGPWGYQERSDAYTHIVRQGDGSIGGGSFIVQLPQDSSGRAEANARLISAAPDMFEALAGLVKWHIKRGPFDEPLGESEQEDEINVATRALAKARGEQK